MPKSELQKERSKFSARILLYFAISLVILYLLIPRSERFHYEYQRGKVWAYNTLKAPFDYPIYKKPEVYNREYEAIERSVRPVFTEDTAVLRRVVPAVVGYARGALVKYEDSLEMLNASRPDSLAIVINLKYCLDAAQRERFSELIDRIYQQGVISHSEVLNHSANTEFLLLRNQVAYETSLEDVYTPRQAASLLARTMIEETKSPLERAFWNTLKIQPLLEVSLRYDSTLTQRLRQQKLDRLSKTQGVVQSGESIIAKGEVVTDSKYIKLYSLEQEINQRHQENLRGWVVELCYILTLAFIYSVLFLFLYHACPRILQRDRNTLFVLLLLTVMVGAGFLVIRYVPLMLYAVPVVSVALLCRTFYDSRLAFTMLLLVVALIGFFAIDSFLFTMLNVMAGTIAIFGIEKIYRRGRLFAAVGFVLATYAIFYSLLSIIQNGTFNQIHPSTLGLFAGNALLILATYQLVYPLERLFGFISNATLMELCDFNQSLLRELAERAPGTFQHSMQVANLAEEAIAKLGGNPLLVRTGALYHDVGKMRNPEWFIENQSSDARPHADLEPEESAKIIIQHVIDGVSTAHKHKLPEQIINFIRTHHGTTRVEYFFRNYKKDHPDEDPHPEWFTYPGPRPFSKEMAVLMMADSVEAASRSLKQITPATLRQLVDGIIDHQMEQQQFNMADITFADITRIKELFIKKLSNIYHSRIEYPEDPDKVKKV